MDVRKVPTISYDSNSTLNWIVAKLTPRLLISIFAISVLLASSVIGFMTISGGVIQYGALCIGDCNGANKLHQNAATSNKPVPNPSIKTDSQQRQVNLNEYKDKISIVDDVLGKSMNGSELRNYLAGIVKKAEQFDRHALSKAKQANRSKSKTLASIKQRETTLASAPDKIKPAKDKGNSASPTVEPPKRSEKTVSTETGQAEKPEENSLSNFDSRLKNLANNLSLFGGSVQTAINDESRKEIYSSIQQVLSELDMYHGTIDGNQSTTQQALIQFQTTYNNAVTDERKISEEYFGILGHGTIEAMRSWYRSRKRNI